MCKMSQFRKRIFMMPREGQSGSKIEREITTVEMAFSFYYLIYTTILNAVNNLHGVMASS